MHKWLLPALIVGVALGAIGCKSSPQASAPPGPQTTAAAPRDSAKTASAESGESCSGETCSVEGGSCGTGGESWAAGELNGKRLQVKVHLPKEALQPKTMAEPSGLPGQRSPALHVLAVLRVTMTSAPGCVIGAVTKGGPADQAGLKPGDAILEANGGKVDCPALLDSWLYCGKDPAVAELTILRPTGESGGETAPSAKK